MEKVQQQPELTAHFSIPMLMLTVVQNSSARFREIVEMNSIPEADHTMAAESRQ